MNCEWNDWQIGQCSVTCGGGTRTNTRTKTVQESNGGVCTGEATLQESCNNLNCPGNINVYPIYLIDIFCVHKASHKIIVMIDIFNLTIYMKYSIIITVCGSEL